MPQEDRVSLGNMEHMHVYPNRGKHAGEFVERVDNRR